MVRYIHKETKLGNIVVKGNGLEVDCVVTVTRVPARGPMVDQVIEYEMYNLTKDHVAGMQPLIDAALAKGKALADAYIAAQKSETTDVRSPRDFSKRTTVFACGEPAGWNGSQREFEVIVQDFCDPSYRQLTIAIGVGTEHEKHVVFPVGDVQGFLAAMAELHATPFSYGHDGEAA